MLWVLGGLFLLYVVLEGLASSYVLGAYAARPADLVFDTGAAQRRVPVWLHLTIGEVQPEGSARAVRASAALFGQNTTYVVPGSAEVDCWHTPLTSFCSTGWLYVFTDAGR